MKEVGVILKSSSAVCLFRGALVLDYDDGTVVLVVSFVFKESLALVGQSSEELGLLPLAWPFPVNEARDLVIFGELAELVLGFEEEPVLVESLELLLSELGECSLRGVTVGISDGFLQVSFFLSILSLDGVSGLSSLVLPGFSVLQIRASFLLALHFREVLLELVEEVAGDGGVSAFQVSLVLKLGHFDPVMVRHRVDVLDQVGTLLDEPVLLHLLPPRVLS